MVLGSSFAATGLISLFAASVNAQVAGQCSGMKYNRGISTIDLSGQTCYIATLSASTPEPYRLQGGKKPNGGGVVGDNCIKAAYKKLGLPPPAGLKFVEQLMRRNGNLEEVYANPWTEDSASDNDMLAADALTSPAPAAGHVRRRRWNDSINKLEPTTEADIFGPEIKEAEQAPLACAPNTLLFARGTTELGSLGSTVGPALSSGLGSGWSVQGVDYSADISGIYCLGMNGGLRCVDQVNKLAAQCPQTKIVLSGYSQGAMVVRICAAWADEKAKSQIKVWISAK
jgi:hypothetical protein